MGVKYGNLSLGQVSELLISIIGRDAALTISDEKGKPIIWKITDNLIDPDRILDRMFGEKGVSFARFKPKEKTSADELYRVFSEILEKEYGFPNFAYSLVVLFLKGTFINALRGNGTQPLGKDTFIPLEGGMIPYEMPTSRLSLLLINWSLGYLGIDYKNKDIDTFKKTVLRLLDDTYQIVFDEIAGKTAENKEDFYNQLETFYYEKYPNSEKLPDFKKIIKRYGQGNYDTSWKIFKLILDFLISPEKGEKEFVHRLIGLYLLKNTESALKKICGIEQNDIYQIKQDVRLWANAELPSEPQGESQCFLMSAGKYDPSDLSELQKNFIDPDFCEQIEAIQKCVAYLRGLTPIKADIAEQLIQKMEEKCPHCGIFFASWARARLSILSCRFDGNEEDKQLQKQALEDYHTAFDKGRNFAGAYLKDFLEECIAVEVYFNRKETKKIPEVIEDKEDKAPITIHAKHYYEYGYALNLFERNSSKTFFLHFHAKTHFWNVFPIYAFINNKAAEQYKFAEDILKVRWFYHFYENLFDHKIIDNLFQSIKHTEILKKRAKDSIINDRMNLFPGHDIQYTPLSIALMTRQPDIAEDYLERCANTLDESKINTDGSTALLEAIIQYKLIIFLDQRDENSLSLDQKYKEIIIKLIKRSPVDALYAETVTDFNSILEEAINTFDTEIVKAIIEKKGFDIQKLKISADELSPLYYTVQRLGSVNEALSKGDIDITNGNINLAKLNVPGISSEEKLSYLEKMNSDPLYKKTKQLSLHQFIGVQSIWEHELSEIKKIVEYLIDKTDDVDAFVKEAQDNGGYTTALSLAVQFDFDDICRLLINKGANPARIFHNNGIPYDSPFIRAALYKSKKIFEILLTDFKEKVRPIINERYREEQQTAAHLLLIVDYGDKIYNYSVNNENFKFIGQFIPLFREAGAEFDIPDISNTTVRQILRKNNLEYLIK